jgi:hypothetical protein
MRKERVGEKKRKKRDEREREQIKKKDDLENRDRAREMKIDREIHRKIDR